MRITIFGGHGKIALLAAPLLSEAGHEVTGVIRNPEQAAEVAATGATPLVLDVEQADTTALRAALEGSDVAVWSAGAGGGSAERTYAVDRDAAIRSMDAAVDAGVPRYVMVSYFGAGPDHGVPESEPFWHYAEAKAAADAHLRQTPLLWTVLGPGRLTDDPPTGEIEVDGEKGAVSRSDVARVLAATVRRRDLAGRTIEFTNGDTAIAEALGS